MAFGFPVLTTWLSTTHPEGLHIKWPISIAIYTYILIQIRAREIVAYVYQAYLIFTKPVRDVLVAL